MSLRTLLPVHMRRLMGWSVPGPRPGFKRDGLVFVQRSTAQYHDAIQALSAGTGVLVPAECWREHHASFDAFTVALHTKYHKGTLSIRKAVAQGGRQDVLVMRLA